MTAMVTWLDGHGISVAGAMGRAFQRQVAAARDAARYRSRQHHAQLLADCIGLRHLGLLEVDDIRRKVETLGNPRAARVLLNGSAATAAKFRKYMLVRTQMSVITGLLVGMFAWITGLPFALEWGVIAFALNYIPFIGPFIATLFPTLLAMTQFDSWQAVLGVFVCLNIIQFVVGSYVEPRVAGTMLSISPTVVLFAIFFWTFLWGLFGAFIGVPIMIAILTFCDQHPSSRWIARPARRTEAGNVRQAPSLRPRPRSRSSPAAAGKAARPGRPPAYGSENALTRHRRRP